MNKLWNAARFTMMHVADLAPGDLRHAQEIGPEAPEDRWILSRLAATAADMNDALEGYHFDRVASAIYRFIWDEFCDWYLEVAKSRLNDKSEAGRSSRLQAQRTLVAVLDHILRLLHPICPFITEEIWQTLRNALGGENTHAHYHPFQASSLCVAPWPATAAMAPLLDADAEADFARFQEVVLAIRNIRGEMSIAPSAMVDAFIAADDAQALDQLRRMAALVKPLARVERLEIGPMAVHTGVASTAVAGPFRISIPLPAAMIAAERARLRKEAEALEAEHGRVAAKLSNENFVAKAPEAVVAKERDRLADLASRLAILKDKLATLGE
jgi:valyl-tRNA synthetase